MPIEHLSWVLPTAKEIFNDRKEILSVWEKCIAAILGKQSTIIITGMAGAGKTVLLEYLTGTAYVRGYRAPGESAKEEKGKLLARKKRIRLVTIPGQLKGARYEAARRWFTEKDPVDIVIHVVANGFASLRTEPAKKALIRSGVTTVKQYRELMLDSEVRDLDNTCNFIQDAILKHNKRLLLLVVASKSDLYASDMKTAEEYYSPQGNNPFVRQLNGLSASVGAMKFEWASMPICTRLESMEWNGQTIPTTLSETQRDQMITSLLERIEASCA